MYVCTCMCVYSFSAKCEIKETLHVHFKDLIG